MPISYVVAVCSLASKARGRRKAVLAETRHLGAASGVGIDLPLRVHFPKNADLRAPNAEIALAQSCKEMVTKRANPGLSQT